MQLQFDRKYARTSCLDIELRVKRRHEELNTCVPVREAEKTEEQLTEAQRVGVEKCDVALPF